MSEGHFDHVHFRIRAAAEEIDALISSNDDTTPDRFGDARGHGYPPEILAKFREAAHTARRAAEMLERLDRLVSSDDGPETFLDAWESKVRPAWDAVATAPPI